MRNSPDDWTVPRILFSSPCGPYPKAPVERDPMDFFYYRNTLGQGMFRLRSFQSWYSLHFLAQNLPVPSVVLENPSMEQFQREVARGRFDVVAITFTVITTARVLSMVRWVKEHHRDIEVILGGYGTAVFTDPDATATELHAYADRVCTGEGLAFMRRYLRDRWGIQHGMPLRQDFLPMEHCFFRTSIPVFKQLVFLGSLGCTFGCSFCSTSSQFHRRRISIASGGELFELILAQARRYPAVRSAIIYDEDFLLERPLVVEFMHRMESCTELRDRPLLLTVFASVRSLRQYTCQELIRCGIGTIYIGVESFEDDILKREGLRKRHGDIGKWFDELHGCGISTLGSVIIGWDGQSAERMRHDAERFVALNPTFYQVMPLHPVPGTALWRKLKKETRILPGYTFETDSIGQYTFSLTDVSSEEALQCVAATYRGLVSEGGPWPFRLYENLLRGYRQLSHAADPAIRFRGSACRTMMKPLLPLSIISGALFRGSHFRKRWMSAMKVTAREESTLFIGSLLVAIIACPFLLGMYLIANLLYWLRPRGDQPKFIRVSYAQMLAASPRNDVHTPAALDGAAGSRKVLRLPSEELQADGHGHINTHGGR